ncbi:MAG TPA: hypothetical protein PLR99_31070 [Polyangiaceae bacterium]|nr:hypothetical protein [Polyangiaceae bacterium]
MSTKHPPDRTLSSAPPPRPAWGSVVARRRALLFAALAALGTLDVACSRAPDRALDDADRGRLGALLAADAKVDALLGEADRLDRL